MNKKILITGASGLVASRLVELNQKWELLTPDLDEFDLTKEEQVKRYVEENSPDLIINFAAFTDVGKAEEERDKKDGLCWKVNVEGVKNLIETKGKIKLIQISTDMVFSGGEKDPGPYEENHPLSNSADKVSWYGWTKNQGEKMAGEADGTVVRIMYPVKAKLDTKQDYIHRPLILLKKDGLYPLFDDQFVTFTFIDDLSKALEIVIEKDLNGIFHVSSDVFSPYELIKYAAEEMGMGSKTIRGGSVVEFLKTQKNKSRYPIRGGLKTKKSERELGMKFLKWKEVVDKMIEQGLTLA